MLNPDKVRNHFPSLSIKNNKGDKIIFLDGPGGTQVPRAVIDSISDYYKFSNANTHGEFETSNKTDIIMDSLREKMSIFLGAENKDCISIGHNMTTLNFSLARGLIKYFNEGDEVVITDLDHEANRGPWMILEEKGIKIIRINILKNGEIDYDDFIKKINKKTVMIAMGMSSNAIGTVNNFQFIKEIIENKNILFLLDAVHYAPHFSINVTDLDCDFLLCSSYKFYGPHLGFLYSRPGLLDRIETERLTVQDQNSPYKIETGTLNHAACSGAEKALDFISSLGNGNSYREKIEDAYKVIGEHEKKLAKKLYSSLNKLENIDVVGPDFSDKRSPTVSFIHKNLSANNICKLLAKENICAWDGHFYAKKAIDKMGLREIGGVTRLGISCYNSIDEIDRTISVLSKI
tara:strand:- start:3323 stop:4534 length:1212 start_codon:yes stop_codon:yes gene_type:complete